MIRYDNNFFIRKTSPKYFYVAEIVEFRGRGGCLVGPGG